jgi:serine/threonine protein kinase
LTAVAQFHSRNHIRGEIKPENLIVIDSVALKLTDSGLAEIINPGTALKGQKGISKD